MSPSDPPEAADHRAFILANTRPRRPALIPEIALHLADEITPIWRMTEDELGRAGVAPPFWAFAWVGGQALARYLLDTPSEVAGKTVLDFATGSGLVAIAARLAGAASVIGADIDPLCAAATALNSAANGVTMTFEGRDLLDEAPPPIDVICAGDICYEQPTAGRVLAWLAAAHAAGARVLIGDPGRSYFPKQGLTRLAGYSVPTTLELEDAAVKPAGVWTFE